MKFVIQRVSKASVTVENNVIGKIDKGFLVLVGITHSDTKEVANAMIKKLINLRIFTDPQDKMNLSLRDVNGSLLLVSQFTLYADCSHGNRPGFTDAAKPDYANELYEYIISECKKYDVPVETIDMTFDKPYFFLIRDKVSGEVWFMGTVYEPTVK